MHVNGKVIGDPKISISGVSEIQNSISNTITFLGNPLYKKYLATTKAIAVLVKDAALLNGKNGTMGILFYYVSWAHNHTLWVFWDHLYLAIG